MFKLKFKQKMKPNFLLCLTLRRKTLEIHVRISRVTTEKFSVSFLFILDKHSNQLRMDNLVLSCPKSNTKEQKLK